MELLDRCIENARKKANAHNIYWYDLDPEDRVKKVREAIYEMAMNEQDDIDMAPSDFFEAIIGELLEYNWKYL